MSYIAIKGNFKRGDDVIKILESLGGKNKHCVGGFNKHCIYFITNDNIIETNFACNIDYSEYKIFSIEEFENEFPFKIGDNVKYSINDTSVYKTGKIDKITWSYIDNTILYTLDDGSIKSSEQLMSFENTENLDNSEKNVFANVISNFLKENNNNNNTKVIDLENSTVNNIIIKTGNNYSYTTEDGTIFLKREVRLPKNYIECCEILGIEYPEIKINSNNFSATCYKNELIISFIKLLICRDAYWKILSYTPDWNSSDDKFYIQYSGSDLILDIVEYGNKVLVFPNADTRDYFYETFKDLINDCKSLI